MQLISYSVLSALALAATTAQAAPSPESVGSPSGARHARGVMNHELKARHARRAANPAPVPVAIPQTLQTKKGKRDSGAAKQKKCRLRPTGSNSGVLPTATIIGSNDSNSTSSSSAAASTSTSTTADAESSSTSSSAAPSASVESNYSNQWQQGRTHEGKSFFDGWDFWNLPDPTHGTVNFQDYNSALSNGLISFDDGQPAIMKSGTHDNVDNRNGIRIHDKETFGVNTLLLMDATHMPVGCGVWPAFWSKFVLYLRFKPFLTISLCSGPNW